MASSLSLSRTLLSTVALAAAALASGCSTVENFLGGDRIDYRAQSAKTAPLEVPPDLSQLARDSRYRPQGGVVSAAAAAAAPAGPAAAAVQQVAPAEIGAIKVQRDGQQRWLVVPAAPEIIWPQLRAFWLERGFTLEIDAPDAGVMETGWAENRAKLPSDAIRNTVGRLLDGLYSTGERDRFRTRVERVAGGSEVFVSHRGLEEVFSNQQKDSTSWRSRPTDTQLEAEFLARLMVKLGAKEDVAKAAVSNAIEAPARARAASNAGTLEVDDGFDRAWRRVGQALDRSGFTVEDRDRNAGLYYVRYVDPSTVSADEPGFLARLFGRDTKSSTPLKLRVLLQGLQGGDPRTLVTVQTTQGAPETGDIGKRIVNVLVAELR